MATSRLDGTTQLILSTADDRAVRRDVERGILVSLARGCHVPADAWRAAGWDERFRLRILAARHVVRGSFVLSHAAAAFVWGMPWVGDWPGLVDITDPTRANTRSGSLVRCHSVPLAVGEIIEHRGIAVTVPSRTVIDVALTAPHHTAVAIADGALRAGSSDPEALGEALLRRADARRFVSTRRVVAFAEKGAESAAESLSRVNVHRIGAPRPLLQRRFDGPFGQHAYADLWWEGVGVLGECDGDKKYLRPDFRGGRTIEQILLDEKKRADWLQSLPEVHRLVRWGWREAVNPRLLATRLAGVGVPLGRPRKAGDPW